MSKTIILDRMVIQSIVIDPIQQIVIATYSLTDSTGQYGVSERLYFVQTLPVVGPDGQLIDPTQYVVLTGPQFTQLVALYQFVQTKVTEKVA